MRFPQRRNVDDDQSGATLTVHSHRDLAALLARDLRGSLVVIDHRDLDAETARTLLDRRPHAVLNAAEFISGRFANLGPQLLADGGVLLLEGERELVLGLSDGARLRLDGTTLYDGPVVALDVNVLTAEDVGARMETARAGLGTQLASFAHTASELLRSEQGLLLHGEGTPSLRVKLRGRPVLVVGPHARAADLKPLRAFLAEQRPVVITVDAGAESAVARRLRPDVAILSGPGTIQPKTLARCGEIVLTGPGEAVRRRAEQAKVVIHDAPTSIAGMDLGLLIAQNSGARLVVPVGYPSTLEDFVDRSRSTQASNVLARLKVGAILVEASAVPLLYTGRVRRWHVAVTLVAAAAVLAVAIATTPVGQDWWHDLHRHLTSRSAR